MSYDSHQNNRPLGWGDYVVMLCAVISISLIVHSCAELEESKPVTLAQYSHASVGHCADCTVWELVK